MITVRRALAALLAATLAPLALAAATDAAATPATVTVGAPGAVDPGSVVQGTLSPTTPLQLTVVLAPRDAAGLASLATAVSTPGSPAYHHYLTVGEFAQRFGAAPAAVAAVSATLHGENLQPGPLAPDGLSMTVTGDASQASAAFGVTLDRYRQRDGAEVFANSAAPHVPASLSATVTDVLGLDDAPVEAPTALAMRPARSLRRNVEEPNTSDPGPTEGCDIGNYASSSGPYEINQVAAAYGMDSLYAGGDLGSGVTVALFELEGYYPSDISAFQTCFGTDATVEPITVGSGPPAASQDSGLESALDIENVIGLAPDATIDVYQGPNSNQGIIETLQAIVDSGAKVVSDSWGLCEPQVGSAVYGDESTLLQEAATAGQSVLVASGDAGSASCSGSSSLSVEDPASQPWATGVGGTKLSSASSPSTQTVWNDDNGKAGGGGISTLWTMPSYQSSSVPGVINSYSSASPCDAPHGEDCREVPDVSANADPNTGYLVYYHDPTQGQTDPELYRVGGTSAAAPVWAGMTALADASGIGGCTPSTPLGFLNTELYSIAAGSGHADAFDDITSGNNNQSGSGAYPATTGYDMATGLGAPIATDGSSSGLVEQLCDALQQGSGAGAPTPPTVSGVSPSDAAPGTTVTIDGSGFASGASVQFGTSAARAVSVTSASQLTATVPAGAGTIDVTVTTTDGTSATGSPDHFTYAPTETISTPASGATYTAGQTVDANYACAASAPGPVGCSAPSAPGAAIDTSAAGPQQFTVTATDANAVSTSTTVAYTVVAAPAVSITTPAAGAVYVQGQPIAAGYACTTTTPVMIASCAGPVGDGAAIDTATPGAHSFTVTATDSNGVATQAIVDYTVLALTKTPAVTTKPAVTATLSGVHQSATRWREHAVRDSQLPVGTTFSFTLGRSAAVIFSFTREVSGRMRGERCVAPGAAPRRARTCLRPIGAGRLSVSAAAGTGHVTFAGHTSTGTLAPGSYLVTIRATVAGAAAPAATLHFSVAAPPHD